MRRLSRLGGYGSVCTRTFGPDVTFCLINLCLRAQQLMRCSGLLEDAIEGVVVLE